MLSIYLKEIPVRYDTMAEIFNTVVISGMMMFPAVLKTWSQCITRPYYFHGK